MMDAMTSSPHTAARSGQTPDLPSVLLVDHEAGCRDSLSRLLRERGFSVMAAASAAGGLAAAERQPPDFAVVDTGGPDGVDLLAALGPVSPRTKVVLMNRAGSIAAAVEALQRGAFHYLAKPVDPAELEATLRPQPGHVTAGVTPQAPAATPTPTLARAVWEHMHRVLGDCDGNVSAAARRLGIARRTLQLKLKKYPPRR
jgi:two-component system response regulator RegA